MRLNARRPHKLQEISDWLRRGEISPGEAVSLAVELRRRLSAGARPDQLSVPDAEALRQQRIQTILGELDGLVGLTGVKRHVRELQAFAAIQVRRKELGLSHQATSLHMVFTGNPGTGKTTVARLLGRLFREMSILPKGHMVEVERADLVGEYIGHTAQKTREVIRQAVGGVLFIDEAYSLARGGEKDFGKESIDCLVRAMEEHRDDLMLILAGYPYEMEWFLGQNPGLRSRFPVRIEFPDYSPEELVQIADQMWRQRQYQLTADARSLLLRLLTARRRTGSDEGNARTMRNLVERSLRCQALRIIGAAEMTRELLMEISRADLLEAAEGHL